VSVGRTGNDGGQLSILGSAGPVHCRIGQYADEAKGDHGQTGDGHLPEPWLTNEVTHRRSLLGSSLRRLSQCGLCRGNSRRLDGRGGLRRAGGRRSGSRGR
jgi:hypothetical protein